MITGGLGLIGTAIADLLLVFNMKYHGSIRIIIAARDEKLFRKKYDGFSDVSFVFYDASEKLNLVTNPDYFVCGAGIASPELYTEKPIETFMSNFLGVTSILDYCTSKKVKRILYISSSEVYGDTKVPGANREGQYGVINIDAIRSSYPIAKIATEFMCKAYAAERDVNTVIVRPGHVYGPTAKEKDKRVSSDFAYRASKNETIVLKSLGLQKRSYTYSVDAAASILCVLLNGSTGEAYNIGARSETSVREMASLYAAVGNTKLVMREPSESELNSFNPMENSTVDCQKIQALGYIPQFSVEEGTEHTVKILKELNQ